MEQLGDFAGIHAFPSSSAEVPDDPHCRLVVFSQLSDENANAADRFALEYLKNRGNSPRINQNCLVFLAPDPTRYRDLFEAACKYLAWENICNDASLQGQLSGNQAQQAKARRDEAQRSVDHQIPEVYCWLLVPTQADPGSEITINRRRLSAQDTLAVRASKKLTGDEMMLTTMGGARLGLDLSPDKVDLWEGDHVPVAKLVEYYSRYVYLQRLASPGVLLGAVRDGVKLMSWQVDSFAFAESYDEEKGRYVGLQAGEIIMLGTDPRGLLVKPEAAIRQMDAEKPAPSTDEVESHAQTPDGKPVTKPTDASPETASPQIMRRFHGSVDLNTDKIGLDAAKIADEVIAHLSGIVGARVKIRLEIEAHVPDGVSPEIQRIVSENSRTLRFSSHEFEPES